MSVLKKKIGLVAAVACLLGVSSLSMADSLTIGYYTVGQFGAFSGTSGGFTLTETNGSTTPGFFDSSKIVVTGGGTTTTLQYNYSDIVLTTLGSSPGNPHVTGSGQLGSFVLSSDYHNAITPLNIGTIAFTLDIYQLLPPSGGSATLAATVTGTVTFTPIFGGIEGSTIQASFSPDSVLTSSGPPVLYKVNSPLNIPVQASGAPTTTTVQGAISADLTPGGGTPAPLPSIASMGMTMAGLLICGLAGRKLARRAVVA